MTRARNPKAPTWTSLVEEALRKADDFMGAEALRAATGANPHQLSAALHHLHKRRAVDSVESNGRLWWFATPETDTRLRVVEERRPEDPGTRRRRRRRKAPAPSHEGGA